MAQMAMIESSMVADRRGINLEICGFTDSLGNYLDILLQSLKNFRPSLMKNQFDDVIHLHMKDLRNFYKSEPISQAQCLHLPLACGLNNNEEQIEALKELTLEKLEFFHDSWLECVHFEWLIMGNFLEEEALRLVMIFENGFSDFKPSHGVLIRKEIPQVRCVALKTQSTFVYENYLQNRDGYEENNSALYLVFEIGANISIKEELVIMLLDNYISDPLFDCLRTDEQLGYTVFAHQTNFRGVSFFNIGVQSHVADPCTIEERVWAFFMKTQEELAAIEDDEFDQFVESVRTAISQKDLSIHEEANRHLSEITNRKFLFDRKTRQLDKLDKIEKEDLIDFYQDVFFDQAKRLEIHIISEKHTEVYRQKKEKRLQSDPSIKMLKSVNELRTLLPHHPDYVSYVEQDFPSFICLIWLFSVTLDLSLIHI
eukprot:TRINITY_DN6832_c0_g1_i3.p1 TRINITY_DN6832_c0_g1~~TRINITY_DN6832_c0_g1_i3.p1  ORF type:complete len:427 (-),score=44.41 TRINITY_DN6832_c0_g1_i3:61-1341(-)